MDRRRYLAALVTAPVTSVAGCGGDGGATDTPSETATETRTATATATPTATETATETAAPTATETPTDTATATRSPTDTATDGDSGTTTGTPTATDSPTATATDTPTPTATPTPSQSQTVEVAPGSFRFSPQSFEIGVGGTVEWVWRADGHNIVVDSQPAGSEWSGTPGDDRYDEGYTHEHTFEVPGTYEYYCAPHEGLGMVGSFEVVE